MARNPRRVRDRRYAATSPAGGATWSRRDDGERGQRGVEGGGRMGKGGDCVPREGC